MFQRSKSSTNSYFLQLLDTHGVSYFQAVSGTQLEWNCSRQWSHWIILWLQAVCKNKTRWRSLYTLASFASSFDCFFLHWKSVVASHGEHVAHSRCRQKNLLKEHVSRPQSPTQTILSSAHFWGHWSPRPKSQWQDQYVHTLIISISFPPPHICSRILQYRPSDGKSRWLSEGNKDPQVCTFLLGLVS